MNITLNGIPKEVPPSSSLKKVVEQFCTDARNVIAQVNGQIIQRPLWEEIKLADGDTLELVNFVGGG